MQNTKASFLRKKSIFLFAAMDVKRRNGGPPGGGVQAKRGKMNGNEWEDSPSHFEEELSMFDEEMDAEDMEGQAGHDVIPVGRWWQECKMPGNNILSEGDYPHAKHIKYAYSFKKFVLVL